MYLIESHPKHPALGFPIHLSQWVDYREKYAEETNQFRKVDTLICETLAKIRLLEEKHGGIYVFATKDEEDLFHDTIDQIALLFIEGVDHLPIGCITDLIHSLGFIVPSNVTWQVQHAARCLRDRLTVRLHGFDLEYLPGEDAPEGNPF